MGCRCAGRRVAGNFPVGRGAFGGQGVDEWAVIRQGRWAGGFGMMLAHAMACIETKSPTCRACLPTCRAGGAISTALAITLALACASEVVFGSDIRDNILSNFSVQQIR